MSVTTPLLGGCICQRVRYQVSSKPLLMAICHCSTCQSRTGSAFSMVMTVRRSGFAVTQGETIHRDLPGASGALIRQHFCENCLVRTHSEPAANETVTYVRPGTLDERNWIKPTVQLWTSAAQSWFALDGLTAFDGNPDDWTALVEAYRAEH